MEDLVTAGFWHGRRVLITGLTGFKGAWLALWLSHLGAEVCGYSLDPPTRPNFLNSASVGPLADVREDIRNLPELQSAMQQMQPEVVFHLAAQPIVLTSYADPSASYAINVLGTVNVLEAVRHTSSVRAVICVTSDKCYRNDGQSQAFRETDPLGGNDPYSSSKACAELVVAAWRESFFTGGQAAALSSARSGNVIGGGDWSPHRLLPDLLRSFSRREPAAIRHPGSIRPWLHVLDSLHGYLTLAQHLLGPEAARFANAYNFGPDPTQARTVRWLADRACEQWGGGASWHPGEAAALPEAARLTLDSSRARADLGWAPKLSTAEALDWTLRWHRAFAPHNDMHHFSLRQIAEYEALPHLA